jgi:glycosyltransferase involved in cell wall biosynthesis
MSSELTFSIIIPAYNRSSLVGRAIASCLRQDHPSFEVIVVDDGSTDGTAKRVSEIVDSRVRLLSQPVNRGVSPARNLAAEHARGEWVVCLDSDDELTPNALALMEADIDGSPAGVDGFRFMCRLDNGSLTPAPPLRREVWDYEAYLRWADEGTRGAARETLTCFRRRTFELVKYPEGRALEPLYHLDFAARFQTATSPTVVRLYHSDAPDQLTRPNVERALASAPDHARSFQTLLERHAGGLARYAPGLLLQYTRGLATQQFLAGDRVGGLRTMSRLIRAQRGPLNTWAVLGLGLLDRRLLAHAQAQRSR